MPLDPTIWNPSLTGPAGVDGKTIHTVSGAPSNLIGEDYDYAIDPVAWVIYGPKVGGVWPAGSGLVGPAGTNGTNGVPGARGLKGDPGAAGAAGAPGSVIHSGLSAPTVDIGVNGDYFFNLTTFDFYGPKTAGLWGVPVNLKGADGAVVDLAYGQRTISANAVSYALTAASPTDLSDNTDYTQITGIWDAPSTGLNNLFTPGTNDIVCNKSGTYMIHLWASLTSDTNATSIAFKFAVNGVVTLVRRPWRLIRNANEIHSISAFGFVELEADDVISLWNAADKTCNITITDAVFALTELEATGRYTKVFDEAVELTPDLLEMVFAGAGVTATLTGGGQVTVTIPGEAHTGDVETVSATASTNITVDNTDPANPTIGWDGVDVSDDGTPVATARELNFTGAGVTVTDVAGVATVDIPGGGGGGSGGGYFSGLTNTGVSNTISSGSFATKGGCYFKPDVDITVTHVNAIIDQASVGDNYYFQIVEMTGVGLTGVDVTTAGTVAAIVGSTVSGSTGATLSRRARRAFTVPVVLEAGKYYVIVAVFDQGSGTAVCSVGIASTSSTQGDISINAPGEDYVGFLSFNTVGLSVSQAPSSLSANYSPMIWIEGTIN